MFTELGRSDRIILFIVEGIPNSNDSEECFHPVIKEKIPDAFGININEKGIGKEQAFVKVQQFRFQESGASPETAKNKEAQESCR